MRLIVIFVLAVSVLAGCTGNPTNEPSADEIAKANADRAKAIDNDPSLTPEGKAKMKEMLRLKDSGTSGAR